MAAEYLLKKKKVTAELQITMLPDLVIGQDQSSSLMMQKPLTNSQGCITESMLRDDTNLYS